MRPGEGAGQEGGRAGGGEIAAGEVVVIDDGAFGQAGNVGGGEAAISIKRNVVGGPGIEDHDDHILFTGGGGGQHPHQA